MYYEKEPTFYEIVIKKEEGPYEFKIHLFPSEEADGHGAFGEAFREDKINMMEFLTDEF